MHWGKERVGVALIDAKMTETHFRWFENMRRRLVNAPIKPVDSLFKEERRNMGSNCRERSHLKWFHERYGL